MVVGKASSECVSLDWASAGSRRLRALRFRFRVLALGCCGLGL